MAQQPGTDIVGAVMDAGSGLPIVSATVELDQGNRRVARRTTASDGSFRFAGEPQGIYTVSILASGYQNAHSGDLVVTQSDTVVRYEAALLKGSTGSSSLRTISSARIGGRGALQTTTTINRSVDPRLLQSENYMRAGDALATVPGLNAGTSSAVGDDESISIRGFNSSETATLLDGHPIGPLGAQGGASAVGGGGFDYQDSPFFGIRNVQAIYGSGATGLYGASTIAGAIDFQTIDPVQGHHGLITQGIGNNGKNMTGMQAAGTIGKLGYALAHAVEGTYGMFAPQTMEQTGLLGTDISFANRQANTYSMSGNYTLRNDLLKLDYAFDPGTALTLTAYSANSWDDKSGNGDTDFNTYQYVLYNAQQAPQDPACAAGRLSVNTDSGSQCMTYADYAAAASGPAGGGPSPWQAIRNQDYHARFTKSAGRHAITLDGYSDSYAVDYNRSVSGGFDPSCRCFTGFFQSNYYRTNGFLAGDDVAMGRNDFGFGFYVQHQRHTHDKYDAGTKSLVWQPEYDLNETSYYLRDEYQMNARLSLWGDLWFKRSNSAGGTSVDPRFSAIYRPTPSDVVRVAAGRSNSVPDPALAFSPETFDTNFNALNPNCSGLTQVATGGNPNLKSETATDVEAAYGHRFRSGANVQLDAYQANEQNALFAGVVPLAQLGLLPPQSVLTGLYQRISSICPNIPNQTLANLSAGVTSNAASATYRGIELAASANVARNLTAGAEYDIQSAAYQNVPDYILQNNQYIINGAQIAGVPLRKANFTLAFANPRGLAAQIDAHFIDQNNPYNRPAFWFANAGISDDVGPVTINLGANNLFNSAASRYGLIGLGTYTPVNALNASAYPNALSEGSEEFGLPYRQIWFTVTKRF